MKTEYQISGMRENGGLHETVTEVPLLVAVKLVGDDGGPECSVLHSECDYNSRCSSRKYSNYKWN